MSSNSITPAAPTPRPRTVLGVHHHVVGDRGGAGGDRFTLSLDVDQALAAGADGCEQRMVAEPGIWMPACSAARMIKRALGNLDLGSVDGEMLSRSPCGRRERSSRVTCLPAEDCGLGVIERATAAGDVLLVLAAEVLSEEVIGEPAPSPKPAQNDFPTMLSVMSASMSRSVIVASPVSGCGAAPAPASRCPPGTGCICRRTRGHRTRSTGSRPHHARGVVKDL